jgi:hypothetical protein
MAGMVSALTDDGAGQVDDGGIGVSRPCVQGCGEDECAAVQDVPAALAGDERVEGG